MVVIQAKGMRTIAIEKQACQKTITVVLFVPNLDCNFLSFYHLLEKGFKLYFDDKYFLIKDPTR